MDLPVWQALRTELQPRGLEIVTVALDIDIEAARPWTEAAGAEHPTLVDSGHVLDEVLGVVNVPSGVWIDEQGVIVRPPETAPGKSLAEMFEGMGRPPDEPARLTAMIEASKELRLEREPYQAAIRDWVERGDASPYALSPQEVIAHSRSRTPEVAEAAACFELGQQLHRAGYAEDAVAWFRKAHRLQPGNWTYRRQAWSLVDPLQGPTEGAEDDWPYDGDWLTDYNKTTPEEYYPPPKL
jgi:hypothetical protein